MSENNGPRTECERAREVTHRLLDGDLLDAERLSRCESHLRICSGCREEADELRQIQDELRAMPVSALPEEALREVLDRTVRQTADGETARGWFPGWQAAAAAVLALALFVVWQAGGRGPVGPGPAEIARAEAETRLVLGLTAEALRRTENATEGVLSHEVSPALRKIPIQWPAGSPTGQRRDANGS